MTKNQNRIDQNNVPKHVAIIMDGNGRWAKEKGFASRIFGHKHAIKAVREAIEISNDLGVEFLTLYTFSTENWNRPINEVKALMDLLVTTIFEELEGMINKNIRVKVIGDIQNLPKKSRDTVELAIQKTKDNQGLTLILALSYSGKWDIVQATQKLAEKVQEGALKPSEINEKLFAQKLNTVEFPDPDLMIRTGGDHRISNFLLWQLAYSELYIFDDLYWPDFRKEHYIRAVIDFQQRERRFGKTSEQIEGSAKE